MEVYYLDNWIMITLHVAGFLHPAIFWYFHHSSDKSGLKVTDCTVQSAEYWCFYGKSFTREKLVIFNQSFFSYGKVNGKIKPTGVFRFYQVFFPPLNILCNKLLESSSSKKTIFYKLLKPIDNIIWQVYLLRGHVPPSPPHHHHPPPPP